MYIYGYMYIPYSNMYIYMNNIDNIYICIYRYIIYIYIYIHKFISKCHSQTSLSLEQRCHSQATPCLSQSHETFLAQPANKQTRNYNTECSNHHPSLSTLRLKVLSRSKMKWLAIYTQIY